MSHRISAVPIRKQLSKETTKVLDPEAYSSKMEHFVKRIHAEKLIYAECNQIQKLFWQITYARHCFMGRKGMLSVIKNENSRSCNKRHCT